MLNNGLKSEKDQQLDRLEREYENLMKFVNDGQSQNLIQFIQTKRDDFPKDCA